MLLQRLNGRESRATPSFLPQKQRFIGCPAIGEHLLDSAAAIDTLHTIDAPLNVNEAFCQYFLRQPPPSPSRLTIPFFAAVANIRSMGFENHEERLRDAPLRFSQPI